MKKRAELAIAALAALFICFALGYFAGRRSIPSEVSISAGTVVITPALPADNEGHAAAAESTSPSPTPTAPVREPSLSPTPEAVVTPTEAAITPTDSAAPDKIESTPQSPPAAESHYTADGLLRINYATQKELESLPGIGEVIASRIIEYREKNGSFSKLSTIKVIKGIGDARYDAIKDLITTE